MTLVSIVKSMTLQGLTGIIVNVEVDVSGGMPAWNVVGLPDAAIKESKERIKTAIKNCDVELLSRKYIINLSPADIRKEGAALDLAIAVATLKSIGKINDINTDNILFLGELSLDAKIKKVDGILPICLEALKYGINKIILPLENAKEASVVEELEIIGVGHLEEVIQYLNCEITINSIKANVKELFKKKLNSELDFSEVKGQESIKRALEIAAAGGHNCMLIGSPGSGKTMMARRITTILPDLSFNEALEITKIHSVAGKVGNNTIITERPFRSPHHTISSIGLIGGGAFPKPGEISLSHYGVLFLDELPEFNKRTIEVLRGPLEDRMVTISRVNAAYSYPCNFMLVASMNPCPCGYYGSTEKECTCTEKQRNAYRSKISGPILDRIDIQIEVPSVKYDKLEGNVGESSEIIRERVNKAREIQLSRYKGLNIYSNAELSPKLIEIVCKLNEPAKIILKKSFEKLNLSARAYSRILKVARTIADLDGKKNIDSTHIIEAISYRSLDKK